MKKNQAYGTWPSPITAAMVAGKSVKITEPLLNQQRIFWLQTIAEEKGRVAIMMHADGQSHCLLPRPLSAKSKVHEYGGGSYTVHGDTLYFVLADDQRVYALDVAQKKAEPLALTPDCGGQLRFADLHLDQQRQTLIAVCEDHRHGEAGSHPRNYLVSIALDGSQQLRELATGSDFYSNPRLSPDGARLCWLSWNHPDLPWDATQLWLANVGGDGQLSAARMLAGSGDESIFQPQWSPAGDLYFVSDRDNWWNLYRISGDTLAEAKPAAQALHPMPAEFATPQWTFNMSCYGFLSADNLLATYTQNGLWYLATLDLRDSGETALHTLGSEATSINGIHCEQGQAVFIGAAASSNPNIYLRAANGELRTLLDSRAPVDAGEISQPQAISFPSSEGERAQALFYPPHNVHYTCGDGQPPLIVICHGGPTGATDSALNLKIQYWTNRGFAVVDVNYRGSTGYGRRFRQRLHGNWGILDVDDVCAAAAYAVQQGWANPRQCVIKGGSAGGYTVLAALAFRDTFNAGVSLYGIGDLELLARHTHKFEARYLDKLVGPYPEQQALYRQRSPLHHADQFACPMLIFQGLQDKVVPPNQAETLVAAARQRGLPVTYISYPDEGHGFRDSATIEHMLASELRFYQEVFDLRQEVFDLR